ncbi:DeoR/GlpR family DNA-binding transcription regulator [Eubacteriales bacterium mix99]|jgi:DeoR family transcriptional regulator of aga operon
MKTAARRKAIMDLIDSEGSVSFGTLKASFPSFSEATLRNDLKVMDERNKIVRVFGGAKSVQQVIGTDDYYSLRSQRNVAKKQLIAQKAVSLLRPNDSIYLDSGTTSMEFAKCIPDERYLILTSGLNSAIEMARLSQPSVHVVGGELNRFSLSTFGEKSVTELQSVNFHTAFLGVTSYSPEYGFMCGSENESILKRTVMERSGKVILLMDSSKVGKTSTYTFATPESVDILVSDDDLSKQARHDLESGHIVVI